MMDPLTWNLDRIREHVASLKKLSDEVEVTPRAAGATAALKLTIAKFVDDTTKRIDYLKEQIQKEGG
jgi:hypothetical protein